MMIHTDVLSPLQGAVIQLEGEAGHPLDSHDLHVLAAGFKAGINSMEDQVKSLVELAADMTVASVEKGHEDGQHFCAGMITALVMAQRRGVDLHDQ